MMNQTNSGFLNSIPPVTKNLIIINLLFWVASLALPKVGVDLVDLLGLHVPGATDFKAYQIVSYMFMHDTHSFAHVFFNMFAVYMFGRDHIPQIKEPYHLLYQTGLYKSFRSA